MPHAPVTHYLPLTHIRRAQLLDDPGRVLVKVGQRVSATDVVAESNARSTHVLVDIRRGLRVSQSEKLGQLIERRPGEKVQKGDILAQRGGLVQQVVRAPVDGEIMAIQGGQMLIEVPCPPLQLHAGISGEVREIIPERGVILESDGALVQGVWGNGRLDMGVMAALTKEPGELLTKDHLDVSMRGAVVVGGRCEDPEVFQAGSQLPLRGLILGSIPASLLPAARSVEFPVILVDGVGAIAMNTVAFRILTSNDKRDASVNAARYDRFSGDRPEVLIPLPANGQVAPEISELKKGQAVRIQAAPYAGQIGTIANLLPGLTRLSNGLRLAAVEIRLENNEQVTIPLVNLDVLE